MTREYAPVVFTGISASPAEDAFRPQPRPTTYVRAAADALARVATATATGVDLSTLLDRLSQLTLEATGGDRVSFFLLDDGDASARLWAAAGPENAGLWQLGVSLPPIRLDAQPALREVIFGAHAVAVADAADSVYIPHDWAALFDLASLVLAPVATPDRVLGMLVVDFRKHRELPEELVRLVGDIAKVSALAVGNAVLTDALADRAASLQSLLDATRALGSPRPVNEVAARVAKVLAKALHARHVSVHVIEDDDESCEMVAQVGVPIPGVAGDVRDALPAATSYVTRQWRRSPKPVLLERLDRFASPGTRVPSSIDAILVLPLIRPDDQISGFAVAGLAPGDVPSAATLELAKAIAAHVAFAVHRARLDERVALAAQVACTLLSLDGWRLGDRGDLVDVLRDAVPRAVGFEVIGVWLALDHDRKVGADRSTERALWRKWRSRRTRPEPEEAADGIYAPIWAAGRVLGILRARPVGETLETHERNLLEALATAIGDRAEIELLRVRAERRDRELALADERSRVAEELHATVGTVLATIAAAAADLARASTSQAIARRAEGIARIAEAGHLGLRQTADSLGALEYQPEGFSATLDHVVATLADSLGVAANVEVRGTVRPLPLAVEQAMIRIVHDVLRRLETNGRASGVRIRLGFSRDCIDLWVRDDGVNLLQRDGGVGPGVFAGLRHIANRVDELGGRVDVRKSEPRGVLVHVAVPV
ncbi:MAG TPA: GAF domain-containing protein [Acidimicrobiales bacterium]